MGGKEGRTRSSLGLLGCIVAVFLWAFKPTLITLTPNGVRFAEVYLLSGGIAALLGTPFVVWGIRKYKAFITATVIGNTALAGACLGVWYYGFYRALKEAPVVEASIIGFSWVLIATLLMPILGPKDVERMTWWQWLIMASAFGGVALITFSGTQAQAGDPIELVWAGIAAVGSGLYLPFGVRATKTLTSSIPSLQASTLVITGANIFSVLTVSGALWATNATLDFSQVTYSTLLICSLIGVGVYIFAEIGWTWGYTQFNSQAVGIMPYLVPAVSTLLLVLFFQERVTTLTLIGMVIIVGANVLMHTVPRKARSVLD